MAKDDSTQQITSGASWHAFCDTLKGAGATILSESAPGDPLDRAEGFRYLSRLTRAALETYLEFSDPRAPVLHRPVHETAKIGADNPDNYYQRACISGDYEYRITGKRGSVHYLGFAAQSPGVASSGDSRQSGYLEGANLEIEPDGSFEIVLSQRERPGNWLRLAPDTEGLIVRQTFLDRENEVLAELKIERIGGDPRPTPLSAETLDQGLAAAAALVVGCSSLFAGWVEGFKKHANELPLFDPKRSLSAGGDPNIRYYHSYWELGPEEALVIEVTPPECDSWNFQLNNYWMESLDYRYFPITLNKHSAKYGKDGSVRIVVAHRDPGVENWIDTVGHSRGTMCLRWIGADEYPQPKTRTVKLSDL
jgi:hypothetical protein